METESVDLVDVLTFHPRPKRLQTQSHYLATLLRLNGKVTHLNLRTMLQQHNTKSVFFDLPLEPSTYGELAKTTKCSVQELQATSMYYLVRKFGFAPRADSTSRFLSGCLADYLRWCKPCLHETEYFHLPWRFVDLKVCPFHKCNLTDRCSSCDLQVPLSNNFGLDTRCPHCSTSLTNGPVSSCKMDMIETSSQIFYDLEYLLLPQGFEDDPLTYEYMGRQLVTIRMAKGLTEKEIASKLNWNGRMASLSRSKPFRRYLDYAKFLGITLQELFQQAIQLRPKPPRKYTIKERLLQIEKAHQELSATTQKRVTQSQIADHMGVPIVTLTTHKELRECLAKITAQYVWTEDELIEAAEKAYNILAATTDKRITQQQIADQIGVAFAVLTNRKKVRKYLATITAKYVWQADELVAEIENTYAALSAIYQRVTQPQIAGYIGITLDQLYYHEKARIRLAEISVLEKQRWANRKR